MQEPAGQYRNVAGPFPQGRQVHGDEVDAVEQILAELAMRHHVRQVAVGRGNDADVDLAASTRPERLEGSVLEDAQHLHLRCPVEIADLVEEDGAAVRHFEPAGAVGLRVGERAAHVSEHLALEQRRRDSAEVDSYERAARAGAVPMNRIGDQLLARTALAGNQDRCVGGGDPPHELEDAAQPEVAPHQISEVVALVQRLPAEHLLIRARPRVGQTQCRPHRTQHLLIRPRLGDEVRGARLHPFDRERDRAPRRDQNHRQRRRRRLDLVYQGDAFLARSPAREVHVLDDQPEGPPAQRLERLGG